MCDTQLNDDILGYLYNYVPFTSRSILANTNVFFNQLFKNDINKIIFIQRFFKKYKIDEEYMLNAGHQKYNNYNPNIDYNDWNDNLMHRYYMAKYEDRYLLKYPEFLSNKSINNFDKKERTLEWINNNLNPDPSKRSRRDIYRFFKENDITSEELLNAGW